MKQTLFALALMAAGSLAHAHGCPGEMKKIDAALPNATLNAADRAKLTELRATGEAQHKAGEHAASMASLAQAKSLLGI